MINLPLYYKIIGLIIASVTILWISRSSLRNWRSHGLYRFFAWEAILALILLNLDYWFFKPFRIQQLISWFLLITSLYLVFNGVQLLRIAGTPNDKRQDPSLLGMEKTTALVTKGVYRYIRHPLYSSLLFLTWGAFFKQMTLPAICLAAFATLFLTVTAKIEEAENILFFGSAYQSYMKQTKMFIPFFI
jgi:protein-S-isoprenylcysteine O-methyltransferase Ste14